MTSDAWLLLGLVVSGAAWIVVHLITTWQAVRAKVAVGWRLLALIPPAAPVVAWMGGRRLSPCLWLGVLLCYAVLRMIA